MREPLRAWLDQPAQSWITREAHATSGKSGYLRNLLSHSFVLCPPGNGEDTHRMWEALYCGAIPVVRESPAMREFKDLPVLFVRGFEEVTEGLLHRFLSGRDKASFSEDKLHIAYWTRAVEASKQEVSRLGRVGCAEFLRGWAEEIGRVAGLIK